MTNEWQEFQSYIHFPAYTARHKRDVAFLGRFTMEMLSDMKKGFRRVLVILARGYLFHEKDGALAENPYDRIDYARKALCAWCSVPKNTGRIQVDFRELHSLFPELVAADGKGWYYRHVKNVIRCAKQNPFTVKKAIRERCVGMSNGFTKVWKRKVQQFQVPLFARNTKAAWGIRFDDVLADALAAGPLRMEAYVLPEPVQQRIDASDLNGVPKYMVEELLRYLLANKRDGTAWVNVPVMNFNAFFGDTQFGKKYKSKIPESLVVFDLTKHGICRAKVGFEKYDLVRNSTNSLCNYDGCMLYYPY